MNEPKNYWAERQARHLNKLTDRKINEVNYQEAVYFKKAQQSIIKEFEATYDKLLANAVDGKPATPADLYNLSRYYEMEHAIQKELEKLGDRQTAYLSKQFENHYKEIYEKVSLPNSKKNFSLPDNKTVKQLTNEIWANDGTSWSSRIWKNNQMLYDRLNEHLLECIITGKKTSDLKQMLMNDFGVSYHRANTLVRTEIAHIETVASVNRYKDYGIKKFKILGRTEKDIGCKCKEENGKVYDLSVASTSINLPPFHPNCRCCIVPLVD